MSVLLSVSAKSQEEAEAQWKDECVKILQKWKSEGIDIDTARAHIAYSACMQGLMLELERQLIFENILYSFQLIDKVWNGLVVGEDIKNAH